MRAETIRPATAREESAVFFPAGGEVLFGVVTRPTVEPNGIATVFASGGAALSMGRNRVWVRVCRLLAGLGYHAFRFDYHGMGESTGSYDTIRLDEPFTADLEGALQWLRSQGLQRFVLIGGCLGARTALSLAPRIDGLEGLVLMSAPIRDEANRKPATMPASTNLTLRRSIRRGLKRYVLPYVLQVPYARRFARELRAIRTRTKQPLRPEDDRTAWVSDYFLDSLEEMVDRRTPVLLAYDAVGRYSEDFRGAQLGRLGRILEKAGPSIEVSYYEGDLEGFSELIAQDLIVELLAGWLTKHFASARRTLPADRGLENL
jgi:pimeloyl-ACP methyl ester carboxylesterase